MDAAQLKADIVLLIDLITEHSRKVELVTHEDLQDEFLSKAPLQQPHSRFSDQGRIRSHPGNGKKAAQ